MCMIKTKDKKGNICQKDIVQCRRLQKLNFVTEIQLLLESVDQYKFKCEYEGFEGMRVCSKYEKI